MRKEAFEPTGLIPRSIIRTFDRFLQQLLPGSEGIAIQEYRVSRYQILVSIQSLCILVFIPLLTNFTIKSLLFTPLIEHFWNSQQNEIFLNAYQEKRAFAEMEDLSEKLFFESLTSNALNISPYGVSRAYSSSAQPSFLEKDFLNTSLWTSNINVELKLNPLPASQKKPKYFQKQTNKDSKFFHLLSNPLVSQPNQDLDFFSSSISKQFALDKNMNSEKNFVNGIQHYSSNNPKNLKVHDVFSKAEDFTVVLNPISDENPEPLKKNSKNNDGAGVSSAYAEKYALQQVFQSNILEIANKYNKQSISAITNILGDFVTFFTLSLLVVFMKPQIIILKSFLIESIYSLSDTTKSFLLILVMDLLVGFHSPRGWEIALEGLLRHLGLPEEENFILLFVALFPVFLDTVFKYWIFRFLNKISPSTVVTYHSMLE